MTRTTARRRPYGIKGAPYAFLIPAIALFLLFFALPIGYAVYLSFRKVEVSGLGLGAGAREEVWAGLQNYTDALTDSELLDGALRVLGYGCVVVPVMLGLALLFALMLDSEKVRFTPVTRLAIFLPYAIPGVVAALLWASCTCRTSAPSTSCSTGSVCRSRTCWTAVRSTSRWRTSRSGAAPAST